MQLQHGAEALGILATVIDHVAVVGGEHAGGELGGQPQAGIERRAGADQLKRHAGGGERGHPSRGIVVQHPGGDRRRGRLGGALVSRAPRVVALQARPDDGQLERGVRPVALPRTQRRQGEHRLDARPLAAEGGRALLVDELHRRGHPTAEVDDAGGGGGLPVQGLRREAAHRPRAPESARTPARRPIDRSAA